MIMIKMFSIRGLSKNNYVNKLIFYLQKTN